MPQDRYYSTLLIIMTVLLTAMVGLIVFCNFKRKKLNHVAAVDHLTGGLSERYFLLRAYTILKGKENCFALVSLQVKNMSRICVSFGPNGQKATLNRLHNVLKMQLSGEELFVRTGEDTFCFLLKNRKIDEISARLERICNTVNLRKDGADRYSLDLCFGIYLPESTETNVEELLGKAVQARLSGPVGHRYHFYDRNLWETTVLERDMADSMDRALQINEFVVYYQPKVSVLDQRIVGAEALVRWRHPQRGMLSPDMFLGLAVQYQKITLIDRFVFENVCAALARWKKQGREICPISLNLARADLDLPNLADERYEICCKYGVEPANIEFELKESMLLENLERAKSLVERFHALGFRCAIDNFGADVTAMQLLGSLDIDTIKLDSSFYRMLMVIKCRRLRFCRSPELCAA